MEQPQPSPAHTESSPTTSLPPLPHIPGPGESSASTENSDSSASTAKTPQVSSSLPAVPTTTDTHSTTAPASTAAPDSPSALNDTTVNAGGGGAIDPFPPATDEQPTLSPEEAHPGLYARSQKPSTLTPMGSSHTNEPAFSNAGPSPAGLDAEPRSQDSGLKPQAPSSAISTAPPALPADYVRHTRKQKAGWGGGTYMFLGVLLFIFVYLAGIPWLSAYLTKNASTLNFGKMSAVLNDLTLPWYKMSATPAVHDVMVQYQSFCFETLGLHPITDMTINDVGAVSYHYKNGYGH